MNSYKTYICIDDTDEIGYGKSTGLLSEEIKNHIEKRYNKKCSLITRHQLFIHEDIPYISHNSSMCFTTFLTKEEKNEIAKFVIKYIEKYSAPTSEPGICIGFEKDIVDYEDLIKYGFHAKEKVLKKEDAYLMAKNQNLHLSEHKNNGQGVVGALAGVALRLYGSDGKIKGNLEVLKEYVSVKKLLENITIDEVQFVNGKLVPLNVNVRIKDSLKRVMLNHKSVVLVKKELEECLLLTREELRKY